MKGVIVLSGLARGVLGATALVLVAAACSGSEVTPAPPTPQVEAEVPVYPVSPAALDAMPEVQAAAIADGTVTEAEFERAVLALVACLEGSGLEVTDFSTKPGSWSIAYASPSRDGLQEEAIYSQCYAAHVEDVEVYYFAERQPTAQEDAAQHEADRIAMVECLQSAGVDISDDANSDEVDRLQDDPDWIPCYFRMQELAGRG